MQDYKKALHKEKIVIAVLMAFLAAAATVIETICLGQVIDILAGKGRDIVSRLYMIVGSIVVQYICNTMNIRLLGKTLLETRYALNRLIFRKTLGITYPELENFKSGELNTLFLTDVEVIVNYLRYVVDCMNGICAAILSLIICIWISWKFFLFCIPVFPIMVFGSFIYNSQFQTLLENRKKVEEEAGTEFLGSVKNTDHIKAYGIEKFMLKRYKKVLHRVKAVRDEEAVIRGKIAIRNRIIGAIPYMSLFLAGIYMIWRQEISAGMFISFAYIFSNIQSLQDIQGMMSEYKPYKVSKERIVHFLDIQPQKEEKYLDIADDGRRRGVYIENVGFSYTDEIQVLTDISMSCYPGTITAIMGESGSGKSTLLKLISGLYPLQKGKITIVGARADINPVGVVFQENFLFNGTIRENIVMGSENIDEQKIIKACKMADVWDEISRLPRGLDTEIAEGGSSFSGGQRQRICIARVLYANPYVLILDEPSASLDPISEAKIIKNISVYYKDVITILVTHRDTTAQYADQIYNLEMGQLHDKWGKIYGNC